MNLFFQRSKLASSASSNNHIFVAVVAILVLISGVAKAHAEEGDIQPAVEDLKLLLDPEQAITASDADAEPKHHGIRGSDPEFSDGFVMDVVVDGGEGKCGKTEGEKCNGFNTCCVNGYRCKSKKCVKDTDCQNVKGGGCDAWKHCCAGMW